MPTISQEELDKLRAGATGRIGPLGAPEGEGLAARSIADYLRGGGGGYGGGRVGSRGEGGLSYGAGNTAEAPDFRALAAARGNARNAGATLEQLQAADAASAAARGRSDSREQNQEALLASQAQVRDINGVPTWSRSEFKPGETARNYSRFDSSQGFQAPGTLGLLQNIFAPKDKDDLDYNVQNPATKSTVSAGYGMGEVDPRLARAAGYTDLQAKDAGNYGLTWGTGRDTLGKRGVLGDVAGWAGDKLGVTSYNTAAAKAERTAAENARLAYEKAARVGALNNVAPAVEPTINSSGRPLSTTDTSKSNSYTINPVFTAPTPVYTPPASIAVDNRDRQSDSSRAQEASNRAQLSARSASARSGSGGALHGGGRNMGGWIDRNMGGPISAYNVGGIAQSNVREEQIQQQQMARAPQIASPGGGGIGQQIGKKLLGSVLSSATGGLGGMLGGLFNDGGRIPQGGPLAGNPHGYNEGGSTNETPIKKVMDEQKLAQQAKAFDMEQARKQEAHAMAMKQKQQGFNEAQKMKKQSAMTTQKPKAPLGG